jgi:DNA-binding PadR family transcriptional regulator
MSVKYAILGLLHYRDLHGYRIKEHIERNFGFMWAINYGQIYANLKKLEEEGLVNMVELLPSEAGGPHKKLYSITPQGREEFAKWLASSPERQMIIRDPFLTRFTFFDFGDKDDALRIIEEQIESYEAQLTRRESNLARWQKYGTYVSLVSELGTSFNRMYLEWLRQAKEVIEAQGGEATEEVAASS